MPFEIDISNDQPHVRIDTDALTLAIEKALEIEQVHSAVLSVSIVDNAAIHRINRDHLQHDFPTDVISFQLDFTRAREDGGETDQNRPGSSSSSVNPLTKLPAAGAMIEGEIIASAQMAAETAAELAGSGPWTVQHELTLYVIHGLLHICGYDDMSPEEKRIMRSRERDILNSMGLRPTYPGDECCA